MPGPSTQPTGATPNPLDSHRSPRHTNALSHESSPYLLQHAHNPVDWRPWGPQAFSAARTRGVPIFLSVGYATCYWCHVMERESFESEEIASIMNERFVCVKVDREERPDVDDIYMTAVQLMTRRGGWPMSVWMTPPGARGPDDPGLEPFFAGTYFPAAPREGMTAFPDLLINISEAWKSNREQVLEQSARVTEAIRESLTHRTNPVPVGSEHTGQALALLLHMHDRSSGGFGSAPKFPQPAFLEYLIDMMPSVEDPAVQSALARALRLTLDRMALGGMFDQVGGGFHRYSTDAEWLVPHFEKMLYDNGQLLSVYARTCERSEDPFDAAITRAIVEYVRREMTHEGGAFFSAQDAEVNAREGLNYLWTRPQLDETLGAEDGAFAASIYGVDAGPNFRDPHHPHEPMSNVLFLRARPGDLAREIGIPPDDFDARRNRINQRLLAARNQRDQPALDDKVIASWNGLMIRGLADAARALHDPSLLAHARRAGDWILTHMREARTGLLLRTMRAGVPGTPGLFEDYAMLASGLIALHAAAEHFENADSLRGRALDEARALIETAHRLFAHPDLPGIYFDTPPDRTDLILRPRSTYDGAIPSGNSVMLHNFIDLYELTGNRAELDRALALLAAMSGPIAQSPVGSINSTRALQRLLSLAPEDLRRTIGADASTPSLNADPSRRPPVAVYASSDRVAVGRGAPATLSIRIEIEPGYHITSHDPGDAFDGLVPLSMRIEGGDGIRLAPEFPPGRPLRIGAPDDDQPAPNVLDGEAVFELRIERTDEQWSGRPIILLTYQPCTDSACLAPETVELDVAIDPI